MSDFQKPEGEQLNKQLKGSDRLIGAGLIGLMGAFGGGALGWIMDEGPEPMIAAGGIGFAIVFGLGWWLVVRPRMVWVGWATTHIAIGAFFVLGGIAAFLAKALGAAADMPLWFPMFLWGLGAGTVLLGLLRLQEFRE